MKLTERQKLIRHLKSLRTHLGKEARYDIHFGRLELTEEEEKEAIKFFGGKMWLPTPEQREQIFKKASELIAQLETSTYPHPSSEDVKMFDEIVDLMDQGTKRQ